MPRLSERLLSLTNSGDRKVLDGELMTLIDADYDEFVSAFADFAHDFTEDNDES